MQMPLATEQHILFFQIFFVVATEWLLAVLSISLSSKKLRWL